MAKQYAHDALLHIVTLRNPPFILSRVISSPEKTNIVDLFSISF